MAGAALDPSALPTCNRLEGFSDTECAVETTDSVGLSGLSAFGEETDVPETDAVDNAKGDVTLRGGGLIVREFDEPLIVASLLLRSSNGAPVKV